MSSFLQDIRFAFRGFSRNPGLTLVIVATLALGIGANTAIFTLLNALLLTPLPVHNPQELVVLGHGRACCVNTGIPENFDLFAYPQYLELRDTNPYFSGLAAVRAEGDSVRVRQPGSTEPAKLGYARLVSANYFDVLGAQVVHGRPFLAGEDLGVGEHPVVVISDRYFAATFARSPSAVGQVLIVNGTPFTIVGVAAPGFYGERMEVNPPDMWVPLSMQPQITSRASSLEERETLWLYPIGRTKPGVNLAEAQAWFRTRIQSYLADVEGAQLTEKARADIANINFQLTPGELGITGIRSGNSDSLKFLMAMVAMLLLICCCNVANLLLARATARLQEIVTRIALGAGHFRIIRQVLTESAMLGLLGGLVGLFVARAGVTLLMLIQWGDSYVPIDVSPNPRVLLFTFSVCVAATLLFGLVPALHASRTTFAPKINAGFVQAGTSRFSLGSLLVVAQVAVCLVVIVVAGLLTRSLNRLIAQDLGFSSTVIDAQIDPAKSGYKPEQLEALYTKLTERVSRLPGVESVALAQYAPFSGSNWGTNITISGRAASPNEELSTRWSRVGTNYVSATGMSLVAGRDLSEQDSRRKVAIVNQQFVKEFLNGENPIGRHVTFYRRDPRPFEIIGVVKDARFQTTREDISPTMFIPIAEGVTQSVVEKKADASIFARDLLVRVSGNPDAHIDDVRRAILEIDRDMALRNVRTLRENVDRSLKSDRILQRLSTGFGALALALASVGLYGLMMYAVVRRTRELGIRLALGSTPREIVAMIMRQSLWLVLMGVAAGIPMAWIAARFASSMLFGVAPFAPLVFLSGAFLLSAVAACAAYLPARRASNMDPALVLRAE